MDLFSAAGNQSGDNIPMAAQVFSCRVQHQICAQLDRAGEIGGGIGIVDHHDGALCMGNPAGLGDINQAHVGVGRSFEIDHAGLGADGRFEAGWIGHIHMGNPDAELLQPVLHKGKGAAIERSVHNDLVPRAEQGPERRGDRPHARGQRQTGFGPLERGNTLL